VDFRPLWANSNSSAISAHLPHGPMGAFFLLQAHARVSYSSPLHAGWANSRPLPRYYSAGSGSMQESHAVASCVLDGPMQAHCSNIIVEEVGPCEDFV